MTRGDDSKRAQRIKGLLDRTAPDMAMEEIPDLCSGEAVFRSLKSLEDAIGDGVSGAGAEERGGVGTVVPGREVCLGKQLFLWLFYLRESRRLGPVYACLQVSYCHSPPLRLLVSDAGFHGRRAVPWRDDPPGCLACMHRDLASRCTPRNVGNWAPLYVRAGCTTVLTLETVFFQARANCLDRCDLLEKV